MAPLVEVSLHLVSRQLDQLVALLARRHGLELVKEFEHHLAVMPYRNFGHGIGHRLWLGGDGSCLLYIIWPVYVELEVAHNSQVVP